jgi:type III restriction enzyme
MKLQFDSSQDYQLKAIQSIVDIFEGQSLINDALAGSRFSLPLKSVSNNLQLSEAQILENIQNIQRNNLIQPSEYLINSVSEDKKTNFCSLNFTVEMETGTGKTYTFLRSIYELNKKYAFKKFVVVVPSVAIREGIVKNLEITHTHFQNLYENPSINFTKFDRNNLTSLRNFAQSNTIQLLIINVDSFTKDNNVINSITESGVKPIEYIQSTNPIVIIDEPQNFETDIRRRAIFQLNPLCTIRFSATHRNLYNSIYSLNPVQAYDLGLVKQIEVDGISTDMNKNTAFIQFNGVQLSKNNLKAKISILSNEVGGIKQKDLTIQIGENLFDLSNNRTVYKNDFVLNKIDAQKGTIEFLNGIILRKEEILGSLNDEIMKFQIERTVNWHFEKVKKLKNKGIKVLSLFFIDKVANYRNYDAENNATKGKFAIWFETAFQKLKMINPDLIPFDVEKVHNGYFSGDKVGNGKDTSTIWADTKGTTAKDEDTYSLIMKEKERLLSIEEPLQFIFSHSALREGWDNPNVFQICTLNETKSDLKKRQEIGRGLRLPVDQNGQRVQDKNINILTIVVNETYENFAKTLQNEIQAETSVDFKNRIKNARKKVVIQRNKVLTIENFPFLFKFWDKINGKTRFLVDYNSEDLIKNVVGEIKKMPLMLPPKLRSKTTQLAYSQAGIGGKLTEIVEKNVEETRFPIPDMYHYIQNKISISRNAIFEILTQSDNLEAVKINPQLFLDNVIFCIHQEMNKLLIENLKYELIKGQKYDLNLFDSEEMETYESNLFNVNRPDKTIFNYIQVQNSIERIFAKDCEIDDSVNFFFKIPKAFKISTPVGDYTPVWGVIFEDNQSTLFIVETNNNFEQIHQQAAQNRKIACAQKHFDALNAPEIKFRVAATLKDLRNNL